MELIFLFHIHYISSRVKGLKHFSILLSIPLTLQPIVKKLRSWFHQQLLSKSQVLYNAGLTHPITSFKDCLFYCIKVVREYVFFFYTPLATSP